jgi:hypothetical protein
MHESSSASADDTTRNANARREWKRRSDAKEDPETTTSGERRKSKDAKYTA